MGLRNIALGRYGWAVVLLGVLSFAFVLVLAVLANPAPNAYAAVHVAGESSQSASASGESSASGSSAAAASNEEIADEETPLAAGPGGGEPAAAATSNLHWFIALGIVAVAAYFLMSTNKLNRNIKLMDRKFR